MKKRGWPKTGLISILSLSLLLFASFMARAEEAKYIYDDLGRLYQVLDEQGNVATYNYDAVGNLLSITRGTGGLAAPEVTGISPNTARGGDTVQVTISGNNLLNTGISTDNPGISVSNVQSTDTSIRATFSLLLYSKEGLTTVTVRNALGTAQTAFNVTLPPPVVNTLSPSSGPIGQLVEIWGAWFSSIPSENVVRFNGVVAPISSCTPIKIVTSVPSGAASGLVTVTTNSGTSNGVNFIVPTTVVSMTPNIGSVEGGGRVTIIGAGFSSNTQVFIGQNVVNNVTVVDPSTLNIITPPGVAGTFDVLVRSLNGDAVLQGGFTYLSGPPEEIVSINPPAGLTNVPINTPIAVLFTRPVDRTTINTASFSLLESITSIPVQGTFSFDFNDMIVTFAPQFTLKPNTAYKLNISQGIKSADGIPLNQAFTGSFTTSGSADTASPTVTVSPVDHATGVTINAQIVFIFSKPMNSINLNYSTIMVNNNEMPVQGNITFNSTNTVATFVPSSNFLANSFVNVALSSRVTDMAGNRIVGSGGVGTAFISSFTTSDSIDNTPPSVVSINPPNEATGIDIHTSISVTFSEPINPASVNVNTMTVLVNGAVLQGKISSSNQNMVITFTPDQPFPNLSPVTVTLTTDISDVAGNKLASPFTTSFTTGEGTHLSIRYSGPATLNSGDTVSINVANDGYLDTASTYAVNLSDMDGVIIYQNTITDIIQAGKSKNYNFSIPEQVADGKYELYAEATDNRGIKAAGSFSIKITGVSATLNTKTDEYIYSPGEPIAGISSVANGPLGIEGGNLKTVLNSIVPSATEEFHHFLPKKGWIPFKNIASIALSRDGHIYVMDSSGGIIQMLDSKGNLISSWGSFGIGDGQLYYPSGIAVGSDGSVYIADEGNYRIQKFDSNGNFITKWGTQGNGNGQFEDLTGIAVGSDGFIYAVDGWNSCIQKFDSNGSFIMKWNSSLDPTTKIAIGPDGSVYVSYYHWDFVEKYDLNGKHITKWGSEGGGNGQFSFPDGIAVGPDGLVYVADSSNHRIQKFGSDGNFIATWGTYGTGNGQFDRPSGIAIGSDGTLFITDSDNQRIQHFDADGNFIAMWGAIGGEGGQFDLPSGVATGPDGSLYVADTYNHRVEQFDSNGKFITMWNILGDGSVAFDDPYGIAVGSDGSVYVTNFLGNVQKFDGQGNFITKWGSPGSEIGQFIHPYGISTGIDSSVYVADTDNNRIQKFDSNGNFIANWGSYGSGNGMFNGPFGIAVGADGSVYVADSGNNRIQKFGSNGNFISTWGTYGSEDGQFDRPLGVAMGSDGSVYVTDAFNSRIQKFTSDGQFILKSGTSGTADGQFDSPNGIAVSPDGLVYVADSNRIQKMMPEAITIFENTIPINQPASTVQSYASNIGVINAIGKFSLQGTLTNSLGQTIAQSSSPFYVGSQEQIISVNPTMGQVNVPINTSVMVLFSQAVDWTTVQNISFSLVETSTGALVTGTFSFELNDKLVVFAPSAYLNPNTSYTLNLTQDIKSVSGIPLGQPFSSSFTTAGLADTVPPTVTVSPGNGATEVPVNAVIVFGFSEPINPMTINSSTVVVIGNGSPVSGNITFNPTKTVVTFTPLSGLVPNATFNVTLSHQVTDLTGNSIVGSNGPGTDFISSFSTSGSIDTVPPQVLSIDPPNGGTITNPFGLVSVTFSEPINPITVNGGTFIFSVGGTILLGQISFSGQNTIVTFTPDQPFPGLSSITVTLTTGISDMAGNAMALPFTSSFTVPSGPILNIGYSGPTTLTVGDTNNITVSNTGDVGTSLTYSVTLSDNKGITVYQNIITDTIQTGSTKTYGFQVPNQAAQGDYTLYAEVIDNRGKKTTGTFNVNITGLSASLNTRTNQDIYSPPDSVTGTTTLLNGPFGIENGSLKVSATQISQSTTGQFSQFLPKKQSWPFSNPTAVAVSADGSVFVADIGNHRIQKFDASGNFVTKWGSEGSGDGQFFWPWGLGVGSDGSIYVADSGNNRVQKFDGTGNLITKWGTEGSEDGQFEYPMGISVGPDGSVYVADSSNHRIQKFDANGNFITKWGAEGSGDGQFEYPVSIWASSDGSVYVADNGNSRIQKFDSNGVLITKWGSYCITDTNGDGVVEQPCDGQFNYPESVAVGPDGSVYVTDDNHRIQKFDGGGNFISQWGSFCEVDSNWDGLPDQACNGQFNYPYGIAVSLTGLVYVADSSNNRIEKFDSNGNFIGKWGSNSTGGIGNGEFYLPEGVAVGPGGSIYVVDTNNHRIQKFDNNGTFITKWGTQGQADGQFDTPKGIAIGPDGSVYIADTHNDRVQKFDSNGNFITQWGTEGNSEGQFREPYGIAIGPDGSVYVSDSSNNCVQKFDSSGNFIAKWFYSQPSWQFDYQSRADVQDAQPEWQFNFPTGIAVGTDGSVYVADSGNSLVKKFDSDGSFITNWQIYCASEGGSEAPCGIGVGSDGSVYVTNTIHFVPVFVKNFHKAIDRSVYITKTNGPQLAMADVAFDGLAYLPGSIHPQLAMNTMSLNSSAHEAGTNDHPIQKFDSNGNLIAEFGSYGSDDGQFYHPRGIAIASDGSIYVADTGNNRIQGMSTAGAAQTVFETTLPINQSSGTTQDYTTNIGTLSAVGKLYLQATLTNSLGQTLSQADYPFYIFTGDTILIFNTDKKVYQSGDPVTITGQVQNRGATDLTNLALSLSSKYPNQSSQPLYSENFDLLAGGNHTFTVTTSAGVVGTVTLTGQVSQNGSVLVGIVDQYGVANP